MFGPTFSCAYMLNILLQTILATRRKTSSRYDAE
jgi:hypothetical protein